MPSTLGIVAAAKRNIPSPIPTNGLAGWWDPNDLALADGATVTAWADRSGAGHNLAAVGAGPIFKTNIRNGNPVVRYDATARLLRAGSGWAAQHWIVVAYYPSANFFSYPGLLSGTTGGNESLIFTGNSTTTEWYLPITGHTYHKDGIAVTSAGPMQAWAVMSLSHPTNWLPSLTLQIGLDRTNPGRDWNGDVGEVISYNRVLSTVERQQVETYLRTKWGTP
jgi:hypothetical protein